MAMSFTSRLVRCVVVHVGLFHTADMDKTKLSCLVLVGGVN